MKLAPFVLVVLFSLCALTCKKEPPVAPPSGPDTTSHNFTWTQYTFGGSPSYFYDVEILNDSDIWAVGAINVSTDSMYNAEHWNGKNWELRQVQFYTICGQSHTTPYPINTVFVFSENNIWFSNGGEMIHWDGTGYEHDCSTNSLISGAINKIFGISPSNIYVVGDAGTALRYDGISWSKQSSGTMIDLHDVWGSSDGSLVWACGYSSDNSQSILLKNDGTSWKTVWSRQGGVTPPYGDLVTSLWGEEHLFTTTNYGVYSQNISGEDTAKQVLILNHFPYRIRGSAENNIAVVGDDGMIWHYNGSTWKLLNDVGAGVPLYSVAVSENTIVAVGANFNVTSSFPPKALIYVGYRSK